MKKVICFAIILGISSLQAETVQEVPEVPETQEGFIISPWIIGAALTSYVLVALHYWPSQTYGGPVLKWQ